MGLLVLEKIHPLQGLVRVSLQSLVCSMRRLGSQIRCAWLAAGVADSDGPTLAAHLWQLHM